MARSKTGRPPHRGRVQTQGGGTEESRTWAQASPPLASQVLDLVDELEASLTPTARRERAEGFRQIREHVRRLAAAGGIDAPHIRSFPQPPLEGGIRVDLEVLAGRACVPG